MDFTAPFPEHKKCKSRGRPPALNVKPSLTDEPLYYPPAPAPGYKRKKAKRPPPSNSEPSPTSFFDIDHPPESYIPVGPPQEGESAYEPPPHETGAQFNDMLLTFKANRSLHRNLTISLIGLEH